MKELIEKIVERLQDLRDSSSNSAKGSWNKNDSLIFSRISHAFQQAIDIIHEEAKAYNESVKTNADYIRSMTDEELYTLFNKVIFCGGLIRSEQTSQECHGCKEHWCCDVMKWLKTEREE